MKHLLILLITIFSTFTSTSVYSASKDIAAIVNDRPITKYEFSARKKLVTSLNKIEPQSGSAERKLNKDILNILIEEELLSQYSEKIGVKISEEEIDNAIKMIEDRNKMPRNYLSQYMSEIGVNIDSFRAQLKGELIKYKIVESLSNSVSVSPSELDVAVINSGFEDFEVNAWIFTSFDGEDKTLNAMEKLRKHLTTCDKVEEKSYSAFANGSRFEGKLNGLDNKTKSIILDTKESHSSSVYQDNDKLKLVLVCSKKTSASADDINKVKHFLSHQKMSKQAMKFFKDLKARAYIKILMD